MPPLAPTPDRGRYIIRSDDARQLAEFISDVRQDPTMELLDTIGPANQPHMVVVAMSHDQARSLELRFSKSNQLKIEPDRPLSLFGEAGAE